MTPVQNNFSKFQLLFQHLHAFVVLEATRLKLETNSTILFLGGRVGKEVPR